MVGPYDRAHSQSTKLARYGRQEIEADFGHRHGFYVVLRRAIAQNRHLYHCWWGNNSDNFT